jgi:hypothetical protein
VNTIVADEKRGVTVRAVLENQGGSYNSQISQVTAAGGRVKDLHLVDRLLRARQGDRRRLRHIDREGIPGSGAHEHDAARAVGGALFGSQPRVPHGSRLGGVAEHPVFVGLARGGESGVGVVDGGDDVTVQV